MAESTISKRVAFGEWISGFEADYAMEELWAYFFYQEFWFDRTRGNLNRNNYDWSILMNRVNEYEKLLKQSLLILESFGWQFEPVTDDPIWALIDWIL